MPANNPLHGTLRAHERERWTSQSTVTEEEALAKWPGVKCSIMLHEVTLTGGDKS